ncbi:hypothetical protein Poli38472_006974 [Pythium oligandrum]|uniref:Uncharacterized protein n=1 Tax=Pythium oligandrum TaxID=41045 RepID=A0A8K1FFB8_PYTOL|nr:hypothetical protein Poli38472_006974 [Pythium oligandrum]|eukprot:TMW58829.1 hypothetical protein Poli38472_006974 [Pythium oligandrum]
MSSRKRRSPVGIPAGTRLCDWADKPMDPRSVASRQRGKIYRARQNQYQRQLGKSVGDLRQRLHNLSIQSALQQRLAAYSVVIRQAVMTRLQDTFEGMSTSTTSKRLGRVRFHIDSFQVQGSLEAPVIKLLGSLRGQLSHSTVHQLYHCTPGNTALLHALIGREVKCQTTHTLFFAADGSLDHELTEADFFTQLASLAPSLGGLGEMLHELPCIVRSGDPQTATESGE